MFHHLVTIDARELDMSESAHMPEPAIDAQIFQGNNRGQQKSMTKNGRLALYNRFINLSSPNQRYNYDHF